MWLHREGFRETLRNWWNGISKEGTASFVLMKKLKVLKDWNMICLAT